MSTPAPAAANMQIEVTKALLSVEVDGKVYAVVLPQKRVLQLVRLAACLSADGKLPIASMGDEYEFKQVKLT